MRKQSYKKNIIVLLIVLCAILILGYTTANHYFNQLHLVRTEINHDVIVNNKGKDELSNIPEKKDKSVPKTISILLMGTDESGYRTDSMLAVQTDYKTSTISMFSIPRDYRVDLSKEVQELVRYRSDHIKLTELYAYAKTAEYESPASLTTKAIEELLDIKFDHIVLFNLKAFRKVVDAVGGVEVYVPRNMNYDDPTQDLYIHLERGLQVLDGKKAEGLVRYRKGNGSEGYGDFGRMEMQQYFLKEFIKKLISVESAMNFNEIFSALKEFVQTDATLNDALYLLNESKSLNFDRVFAHTLPGKDKVIEGKYYYNPPELLELHSFVANAIAVDKHPTKASKDFTITILNGTGKKGMATKYKEKLALSGYNIEKIGDSYNSIKLKTEIIVPKEGCGLDLKAFFKLSEIIVEPKAEGVTIILGQLEE